MGLKNIQQRVLWYFVFASVPQTRETNNTEVPISVYRNGASTGLHLPAKEPAKGKKAKKREKKKKKQ